jgi:hypothetical protein
MVHPLFDEASFYRLATRESVWADRGRQSVIDFFHGLTRQLLLAQWQEKAQQEAQPWGLLSLTDESVHEFLTHNSRCAQEDAERAGQFETSGGAKVRRVVVQPAPFQATPALVLLALSGTGAAGAPAVARDPAVFTGAGEVSQTEFPSFDIDIPIARLLASDVERRPQEGESKRVSFDKRRCLVLILTYDIVVRLARILGRGEPADEPQALRVIQEALCSESLSRTQPSEEALRRAFQLSGVLALAPGLSGSSDSEGRFQMSVDLGKPCRALEPWTWVLACVDAESGRPRSPRGPE